MVFPQSTFFCLTFNVIKLLTKFLLLFLLLQIYNGKVSTIMQFGCFVQMEGLRKRWEGLVHISQVKIHVYSDGIIINTCTCIYKKNQHYLLCEN